MNLAATSCRFCRKIAGHKRSRQSTENKGEEAKNEAIRSLNEAGTKPEQSHTEANFKAIRTQLRSGWLNGML
jgi:hypothetical protein